MITVGGCLKALWAILLIGALFVPIVAGCANLKPRVTGELHVELSDGDEKEPRKAVPRE